MQTTTLLEPLPDDARRWGAVAARDPRADGRFVYAVRTTRIYCRPSCASRRPRRENVTFYATPAAAVGRGVPGLPALPARRGVFRTRAGAPGPKQSSGPWRIFRAVPERSLRWPSWPRHPA